MAVIGLTNTLTEACARCHKTSIEEALTSTDVCPKP